VGVSGDIVAGVLWWRFRHIFDVFVHNFHLTLWLLRSTLWRWWCRMNQTSYIQRTYQVLASYNYPLLSYGRLNLITLHVGLPSHWTFTAHAVSHVTYHRGKNDRYFWNPWPQFVNSLCHFHGATTKIKLWYWRKISFSHCEGYKVHCACAVSRGLPKPHVTIFWPQIVHSLYKFYGATMTIMGISYMSIFMLKQFSVAKKQSSHTRCPKFRFFGNLRN